MAGLKEWLNGWWPEIKAGNEAFMVSRQSGGHEYKLKTVKIRTVGRTYVTVDDAYGSRFMLEDDTANHLLQDCDSGYPAYLFFNSQQANDYIRRQELLFRFRKYGNLWAENASLKRLEYAEAVLAGKIPEDDVPAVTRRDSD